MYFKDLLMVMLQVVIVISCLLVLIKKETILILTSGVLVQMEMLLRLVIWQISFRAGILVERPIVEVLMEQVRVQVLMVII